MKQNGIIFKIIGAGEIRISENSDCRSAGVKGFSLEFRLSGENTFSGGLLSKKDAEKLADHIIRCLKIQVKEKPPRRINKNKKISVDHFLRNIPE